ncbi:MAG TPA: PIN domain-containing protein [bacterium]|nr:PIN domain-containing protein [bacterium]
MNSTVFFDTTAFEALICRDHPGHAAARRYLEFSVIRKTPLISSRHILYALADTLRRRTPGVPAATIINALLTSRMVRFESLTPEDESEAWRLYIEMDSPWWDFQHCATVAQLNRLGIRNVFCFDSQYARYGFKTIPEDF